MSDFSKPFQDDSQNPIRQTGNGSGKIIAAVLITAASTTGLLCCGVCGGLNLFGWWLKSAVREHDAEVTAALKESEHWMEKSRLWTSYESAFDAVATNRDVMQTLGEPIRPASESEIPFRWLNRDDPDLVAQTIEFDVRGPHGDAQVVVVLKGEGEVWAETIHASYSPESVHVTLPNGSELSVLPSKAELLATPKTDRADEC